MLPDARLKYSGASYPDAPNSTEIVLNFGDHSVGMVPSLIYRRECLNADSQAQGVRMTFRSKFLAMLVMLTVSMQLVTIRASQAAVRGECSESSSYPDGGDPTRCRPCLLRRLTKERGEQPLHNR